MLLCYCSICFFFFQAEDGIRDVAVTGVQTCALPIFNVLVYDHDEGQLVRVSVPMWLARKVARDKDGLDLDLGDGRAERTVRRHLRFEDLERAGLGVLVEGEEKGGDLVLVWLK